MIKGIYINRTDGWQLHSSGQWTPVGCQDFDQKRKQLGTQRHHAHSSSESSYGDGFHGDGRRR